MRTATVAFLASATTAAILTPVIRGAAHRYKLLDHARTTRKIHVNPTPRLGGIAIVLAFYAPLLALFFVSSDVGAQFWSKPTQAFGLIAGGLVIAALGVLDDLRGTGAKLKFFVQFGVAAGMYAAGFRIDHIANPLGGSIQLGWLALPFTMLWIAGVINAMNLIDGLDGLAGGVAFIAVATTFAIAFFNLNPLMLLFTAALGGAILGFLFYNFNPATIFMGDTGSMFLGFVLATTAIQTNHKSPTAVAIAVPIVALGVPIADTLLAMLRRAARGAPLFSADRGHIHHRLLDLGLSQRQTVLILYGASLLLGIAALTMTYASSSAAMWCLLIVAILAYFGLRGLGFLDLGKAQAVLSERRRNIEVRSAIRRVSELLRSAQRPADLWTAVRQAADTFGATSAALDLGDGRESFSDAGEPTEAAVFTARFALKTSRSQESFLELGWADGRTSIDRDTEIAVNLLCTTLAEAIERVQRTERSVPRSRERTSVTPLVS